MAPASQAGGSTGDARARKRPPWAGGLAIYLGALAGVGGYFAVGLVVGLISAVAVTLVVSQIFGGRLRSWGVY
jgi:hypothetical protein